MYLEETKQKYKWNRYNYSYSNKNKIDKYNLGVFGVAAARQPRPRWLTRRRRRWCARTGDGEQSPIALQNKTLLKVLIVRAVAISSTV